MFMMLRSCHPELVFFHISYSSCVGFSERRDSHRRASCGIGYAGPCSLQEVLLQNSSRQSIIVDANLPEGWSGLSLPSL